MAGDTVRKLIVEVVEARDLLPKDGTGTSSPYVVVDFDGQRRRTQTVRRDLNPIWNEVLAFDVLSSGTNIAGEQLEVDVYHDRKVGPSRRSNFLGRVRLDSRQFVNKGEEALIHYPLEKKRFFSWIRGDIGLKIYYVDEPIPVPEPPPPEPEKTEEPAAASVAVPAPAETTPEAEKLETAAAAPSEADAAANAEQTPAATTAETSPSEAAAESEGAPPPEADEPPSAPEIETENVDGAAQQPTETEPDPPAEPAMEKPAAPQPPEPEKEATPKYMPPPPQARPVPRPIGAGPEPIERSSFDLVDKMQYLFVRVVRARSLPSSTKPHVRVFAYGRHASTQPARRMANFSEFDQIFAFALDSSVAASDDSSTLEISVWDLPPDADIPAGDDKHFIGGVCFDVSELPTRDPPDSSLAPQWYRLEGGRARAGDLMLATWIGTQADESFRDAWKADGSSRFGSGSKVYQSPKLWYLRTTVIEVQETLTAPREIGIAVKATLGFQVLRTRPSGHRAGAAPAWNEDLVFVAAEPFSEDQKLIFQLEARTGKETVLLGSATIPLSSVERRVDDRRVASRWLDLFPAEEKKKKGAQTCGGRLHVRVCLDGGYHVADEPSHVTSDYRPSARQLWRPPIGDVQVGIIGCRGLLPMRTVDGKGTTDAFALAKYGPKWARTRTVADSFEPAWNEQYVWEVHDPCTVLTIGIFDESGGRPMGRIRVRISTLESDRAYRGWYPLWMLLPSGVKKMGEIEIAVRFARAVTKLDLLHLYGQPMLPAMHYIRPIAVAQREPLRMAAARIVAGQLSRSEPPVKKEVVLWMLEAEPKEFSMRRVRLNWQRIAGSLAWIGDLVRWAEEMRRWRNPTATMMAHAVMVVVAWYPELIVPAVGVHLAGVGVVKYRRRPRGPEAQVWVAEPAAPVDKEELDEEWDPVPSARGPEVVKARYDRVRTVGARLQGVLGDVAAQAERVQALVSWRDPRATGLFIGFCLLLAAVLFFVPARMVAVVAGFYYLRHPMFRDRLPPAALNFFRRLPALSDRYI